MKVLVSAAAGTTTDRDLPTRLPSLTGMRYLAAVTVVISHFGSQFTRSDLLAAADSYGYIGVTFFFLLSGFVLTWSDGGVPPGRFVWSRLSRVWPLQFVVGLLVITVFAPRVPDPGHLGRALELTLLQAWSPRVAVYSGGNGVTWSLSCELFFYCCFPFVAPRLRRLSTRALLALAVGVVAVMAVAPTLASAFGMSPADSYFFFYVFPPYRFCEFLIGMMLAIGVRRGLVLRPTRVVYWFAVTVLALLLFVFARYAVTTGAPVSRPLVALAVLGPAAALVLVGTSSDVVGRLSLLASKPMQHLGAWSFALYLLQKPYYFATEGWGWGSSSSSVERAGSFLVFLGFATAVAAVLYYGLERPAERALRRISIQGLRHRFRAWRSWEATLRLGGGRWQRRWSTDGDSALSRALARRRLPVRSTLTRRSSNDQVKEVRSGELLGR